jgi:hypothetical protein
MDEQKFKAWLKNEKLRQKLEHDEYIRKNGARLKAQWGEIADLPRQRPLPEPKCADFYIVGDVCGDALDDITFNGDMLHCKIHIKEPVPQDTLKRPRLILKKTRDVIDVNDPKNTGWIELELSGENPARQKLEESLLWHNRSVKHRAGIIDAIKKMTLELSFPSEK